MRRRSLLDDEFFAICFFFIPKDIFAELERKWNFVVEKLFAKESLPQGLKSYFEVMENGLLI